MADTYEINGRSVSKAEYDQYRERIERQESADIFTNESIFDNRAAISDIPEIEFGARPLPPGITKGAMPKEKPSVEVNLFDTGGRKLGKDLRVKILTPPNYWTPITRGPNNILQELNGVIFPYTPSIQYELKAEYSSTSPIHSNHPINFYQKSSIGNISISGKFTVESVIDAGVLLSTMHLLKALTRMRSGGRTGDADSGSPPPVCRLMAHGDRMLSNIPVAISSVRLELPDSVDYFTLLDDPLYGSTSVPTISTLSVSLVPMYSRAELQEFSVGKYINGTWPVEKGFV